MFAMANVDVRATFVQFANSPDAACIDPKYGQQKDAGQIATAIRTIRPTAGSCLTSLDTLSRSLVSRPWQFFTTPIEAMFAAREQRSAEDRELLRKRVSTMKGFGTSIDISLATELREAFGPEDKSESWRRRLVHVPLPGAGLYERLRPPQDDPYLRSIEPLRREWPQGQSTLKTLCEHRKAHAQWLASVKRLLPDAACRATASLSSPPLGWTLGIGDRELLSCMAAVATLYSNIVPHPGESPTATQTFPVGMKAPKPKPEVKSGVPDCPV